MNTFAKIYAFASDRKKYMSRAVLLLSAGAILSILPYYMVYQIILHFIDGHQDVGFYIFAGIVILVSMMLKHTATEYGLKSSHKLAYDTLAGMRKHAANKLLHMPMGHIQRYGSGDLKIIFVENVEAMEMVLAHGIPEGIGNQITSVMDILNDYRFKSFKNFIREFDDVKHNKGKLLSFSLFIIMDVDDCTLDQKSKFISKEMFKDHWLFEYIVPIYNDPNLEATMRAAKIEVQRKKDYILIFPTNHGDLDIRTACEFQEKVKTCRCSNLNEYVDRCISIVKKNI